MPFPALQPLSIPEWRKAGRKAQKAAEIEVARLLAADAGVRALLDRWIPLTESMPEPGRTVQLLSPSTEHGFPCANVGTGWRMNSDEWMGQGPIAPPTHWKPMPELPDPH